MPTPQAVPSVLVLGQVGVRTSDGVEVAVTGHAGRLLSLLVDSFPAGVSRERLESALWGDDAPATSASAFRVHLTRLRRHLEPIGVTVSNCSGTLKLEADALDLDVELARLLGERAYRRLQEADAASALEDAERALGLFRGVPFHPFSHEPAVFGAHERSAALQVRLEELAVDAALAEGGHDQVLGRLESMVVAEPLHEHRWGQLMVALYRAGRQADALATYQRARHTLVQLVGAEPGPELQNLERAILTQDAELLADPSWGRGTGRPAGSASIVGRSAEMDDLERHLAGARLVTVVGARGSGTSTFVRAFARERAAQFEIPVVESETLHLLPGPDEVEPDPLEGPRLAVVDLDSPAGERELAAVRHLLDSGWKVLAAAPAPLGTSGEVVVPIRPLSVAESAALIALRLGIDETTPALVSIAESVGGHPLSLQLAAGWVATLGADTAAGYIVEGSLSLLDSGDDLVAQVARVRESLDERADTALLALSAFRHDIDVDAAVAVTAMSVDDAARALSALRDSGLMTAEGGGRWRIPPALRDAVRRLADDEGVLDRALERRREFLLGVLAPWGMAAYGIDGPACVAAIDPWSKELMALASEDEVATDLQLLTRLSEGHFWYWDASGRMAEGDAWFESVVAHVDADPDHPAAALLLALAALFGPSVSRIARRAALVDRAVHAADATGHLEAQRLAAVASAALSLWEGDGEGADAKLTSLMEDEGLLDDLPFMEVTVLLYRGLSALVLGDLDRATRDLTAGHRRATELGSEFGQMVTLRVLAQAAEAEGDRAHALACYRTAIACGTRCGPGHRPDHAQIGEAELLVLEGDDEGARRAFEAAVVGRLAIRDHPASADCFCGLAEISMRRGRSAEAAPAFRHGLLLAWRARDRRPLVRAAVGLAALALERGDVLDAARALGAIEASRGMGGRPLTAAIRADRDALAARLPDGDPEVVAALEEGRAGGIEALVAHNGVLAAVQPA